MNHQEIILGLRAMAAECLRCRDGFDEGDEARDFWQGRADLLTSAADAVKRYQELLVTVSS